MRKEDARKMLVEAELQILEIALGEEHILGEATAGAVGLR